MQEEKLLTIEEAAAMLGIKTITLRGWKWIKRYQNLPRVQVGKYYMYRLSDIQKLCDDRKM